jgi:Concanavalin A-like lectin/glucanases superfamily/Domain of unknown function (DUF2341)
MAYSFYRAITIDHTKVPNTTQTNFPVLIAGTYSYLATVANAGNVQNSSGYDIVFAADSAGTTLLSWEVESYNPATGAIVAWVKVPSLSPTVDTVIYLLYGNAAISTLQTTPSATWSNSFALALHMSDDPTIATPILTDSATANNIPLGPTQGTGSTLSRTTGLIGNALTVSGATEYNFKFFKSTANSGAGAASATVSGWFYRNTDDHTLYDSPMHLFGLNAGTYPGGSHKIQLDKSGTATFLIGPDADIAATSGVLATNAWHHFAGVVNTVAQTADFYLDGARVGGLTAFGKTERDSTYQAGSGLNASYDELRVASVARSADWIATEYNNQSSPATFYSIGAAPSAGAAAHSGMLLGCGN